MTNQARQPELVVRNLSVRYKQSGTEAISGLSFEINRGEAVGICGPSGCGKSTLMGVLSRIIGPKEATVSGAVELSGSSLLGQQAPPDGLGYVIERAGLLPWRTLRANIELGLQLRNIDPSARREVADQLIREMGLNGAADHFPQQLSSGMRRRGSLARTLALKPSLLLLDEPFGNLDVQTRAMLHIDLQRRWVSDQFTQLLVTHDVDEALTLSHRVIVLTRPAHVVEVLDVPLPWPRDPFMIRSDPEFQRLSGRLWRTITTTT